MRSMPSPIVTLIRFVHPANEIALISPLVTSMLFKGFLGKNNSAQEGQVTVSSSSQPVKASSPTFITLSGIVRLFMFLQPKKADSPMSTTGFPL